jgi:hypothetical protein
MFGNQLKDEAPSDLKNDCTGPEKSKIPINTNARTYVGIANGSIRAQLKSFLPGKSQIAVSHAAPTPSMKVPAITPMHNIPVFFKRSNNSVSTM